MTFTGEEGREAEGPLQEKDRAGRTSAGGELRLGLSRRGGRYRKDLSKRRREQGRL